LNETLRGRRGIPGRLAGIKRQVSLRAAADYSTSVHRTLVATRDSFLIV